MRGREVHVERTILFVLVAALLVLGTPTAIHCSSGAAALAQSGAPHDADDAPLQLYALALGEIQHKAMFSGYSSDASAIVGESLKTYLAAHDRYSAFLTRDEYLRFRGLGGPSYAGIGMELSMQRDGTVLCEPSANGPAELAGIRSNDRLVAIDGVPVQGKPLPALAALAAGAAGTRIELVVAGQDGATKRVQITRARLEQTPVSVRTYGSARVIELSAFTPDTRQQLAFILSQWPASLPVIIDLRGCGGGDFYAAVDSAMLFLERGETIVRLIGRSAERTYVATTPSQPPSQAVFVWQDETTASAGEVFIAALTDNARARSVGRTSGGKGSRQDVIELPGGAALVLTTGYLATPHGLRFDGRGLAPGVAVAEKGAGTRDYLNMTAVVMNQTMQR
jgi:carboxyl-terminal processing protease